MTIRLTWGSEQVNVVAHSDQPGLTARFDELFLSVWPEYNRHGDILNPLWGRLYESFPEYQFVLVLERTGELLARGNTVPLNWDGSPEGLPAGIDQLAQRSLGGPAGAASPNALSAMAAEVPEANRSRGLGSLIIRAMGALAAAQGLERLLAPVRPSWKERYPLAPINQYMHWKASDGRPFDPWIRLHLAVGAVFLKPAPRSLRITGTVAEWESWTGMPFPATGVYVFPRGLSTLDISRDEDTGRYWEPNVWMLHPPQEAGDD